MDFSAFNFENLAAGHNPFETPKKKYEADPRFFKLTRDADGNGQALIRFLPDAEMNTIQPVFKINTTIEHGKQKRFVDTWSPQTIGAPCPFQERWALLYNSDRKEEAKKFSRTTRYIANIKVLRDPANPENEGKIFLLDMSGELKDKVKKALQPSADDIALGDKPKELFNPLKGNSFRLISRRGSNGIANFNDSKPVDEETSIYESPEAAIADIKANTHPLSDFLKPESFKSYEELKKDLEWVTFQDSEGDSGSGSVSVETAETKPQTGLEDMLDASAPAPVSVDTKTEEAPAPSAKQASDLDSLLGELI